MAVSLPRSDRQCVPAYLAHFNERDMLHIETLLFINDLANNNEKVWFDANKPRYEAARADFERLVSAILGELSGFDRHMKGLTPRQCIFRIYRDVRFSKDKSPYKTHFGGAFADGGKRENGAGYYLHVEPGGKSFVAGGMWMPESAVLKKIRQEIDYNLSRLEAITQAPEFRLMFPQIEGESLARPPQGYAADNPAIAWLKLKSFTVSKPMTDEQLTAEGCEATIVNLFRIMKPMLDFLRDAAA